MVCVSEPNVGGVVVPDEVSTSNCTELEVPPPGAGECTVMVVVPALAISAAVTCAVSWVALTNCVSSAVVPQYTVEPLINLLPLTVRVKDAPPAIVYAGDMLPKTG